MLWFNRQHAARPPHPQDQVLEPRLGQRACRFLSVTPSRLRWFSLGPRLQRLPLLSQLPGTLWPLTRRQEPVSPHDPFTGPGVLPQTAPGHRPLRTQNSAGRPADNGRRRARSKLSTEEVFCLHSPAPGTGHLVWGPHTQHTQNQILRVPHSTDRPGAWPLCTWPSHAAQPRGTLLSVLCPPRLALSPNASVHTAPSPGNTPSPPRHPANSTSFRRSGLRHRLFRRAFQNPQHYPRPRGCPHVHRSLP